MEKKKSFENIISNILGEPVSNLCHAFYDQYVEANVKFRSRAGMKTVIIRRQLGKCCKWCADLAGIYEYGNHPDDVFRRHDNCKCMVTYKDEDGYTDVWSKKTFQSYKNARRTREREIISSRQVQKKKLLSKLNDRRKTINWPKDGKKITRKEFKELRSYANSKGLEINGIKDSIINIDLAKDVIDRVSEIFSRYKLEGKFEYPFTIDFSHALLSDTLAESYKESNHIIYFNKEAYINISALEKNYADSADSGHFVRGTKYWAVPYHEMGHIVGDVYNIDALTISKKILGIEDDARVLEKISEILSEYAGKQTGDEIISECFSAYFGGADNDFALKFIEECDSIILNRR